MHTRNGVSTSFRWMMLLLTKSTTTSPSSSSIIPLHDAPWDAHVSRSPVHARAQAAVLGPLGGEPVARAVAHVGDGEAQRLVRLAHDGEGHRGLRRRPQVAHGAVRCCAVAASASAALSRALRLPAARPPRRGGRHNPAGRTLLCSKRGRGGRDCATTTSVGQHPHTSTLPSLGSRARPLQQRRSQYHSANRGLVTRVARASGVVSRSGRGANTHGGADIASAARGVRPVARGLVREVLPQLAKWQLARGVESGLRRGEPLRLDLHARGVHFRLALQTLGFVSGRPDDILAGYLQADGTKTRTTEGSTLKRQTLRAWWPDPSSAFPRRKTGKMSSPASGSPLTRGLAFDALVVCGPRWSRRLGAMPCRATQALRERSQPSQAR